MKRKTIIPIISTSKVRRGSTCMICTPVHKKVTITRTRGLTPRRNIGIKLPSTNHHTNLTMLAEPQRFEGDTQERVRLFFILQLELSNLLKADLVRLEQIEELRRATQAQVIMRQVKHRSV